MSPVWKRKVRRNHGHVVIDWANRVTVDRVRRHKPGYYTRMWAAIRHATGLLERQPCGRRLLLLADDKANDLDKCEGHYGIEDTRHSIQQTWHLGISPFCVIIDERQRLPGPPLRDRRLCRLPPNLRTPITAVAALRPPDRMMKVRAATKFLPRYARSIGFSVVLVLSAVSAPAQEYERDAVLRFNLVCAHCHEAECSGRLSFTSGPKATFDHIRRFAGEVAPATALQLNAVLAYMKQHCAYAPIAAIDSVARVRKDILDGYRDASTGGYFLPLGHLEGKRYRIALNFSHPTAAHLEVLNEFFSLVLDESAEFNENALSWEFGVEEPASHFLRVRVDSGLTLDELRLTTAE